VGTAIAEDYLAAPHRQLLQLLSGNFGK
jgi:hypothetical protein